MSKLNAFFGQYGGQYVPEALIPALNQLETEFCKAQQDPAFLNELNTIPGLTATSRYPSMISHAGYSFSELIDRLIQLAMEKRG